MGKKMAARLGLLAPVVCLAPPARAQTIDTRVFETLVPFSYDRGHNTSVVDRPRPEYDPTGIPVGAFEIRPSLDVRAGYTSNVFQIETDKRSDEFVTIAPSIRALSNWSVHSLSFDANANLRRYFDATERNEDGWGLGANGRLDVAPDQSLGLSGSTRRLYESQFSGATVTRSRSAIPVQVTNMRGDATFAVTRLRAVIAGDWSRFDYKRIEALDGTILSQRERDRDIARLIGHAEYGLTPDLGVFVQILGARTNYAAPLLNDRANRDSREISALAGVSADLTALVRGSIGIGYVSRNYRSNLYNNISGVSVDAKIEYFPTELTTLTLAARRRIEDAVIAGSSGFWNLGGTVRVDHELLRNLIVDIGADVERDSYRGIAGKGNIAQVSGGAVYYISRAFGLNLRTGYARRTNNNALIGPRVNEYRVTAGVTIRR